MAVHWHWSLDFIGRWASFDPHRQVVHDAASGQVFTYRQLDQRARALAAYLLGEMRVAKGDRVAVLARNCVEYLDFFFAAVKAGVILVPLNIRLTAEELSALLRQTTPRLLAFEADFEKMAAALEKEGLEQMVRLGESRGEKIVKAESYENIIARTLPSDLIEVPLDPEDPVLIIFTGGTTGPAKGAVISHRAVLFNLICEVLSWRINRNFIVPNLAPFFHVGGWYMVTLPLLYAGGQVIINSLFDPELTLNLIIEKRCTFLFAAATMYQMISQAEGFQRADLSSLQFVMSGGAPCPRAVMEPYWEKGVIFVQGYGITEGGPHNLFMPWDELSWEEIKSKSHSVGKPMIYCRTRIVDDAGNDVKQGERGELLLGGPQIFSGYWEKPEETANALREGWMYTGDIATQDESGFFYIVDRKKDMFISGAVNIYPVEIERVIALHPKVAEAAVIGIPDEKWGEVGKAFVVARPKETLRAEEITAFLQDKLAKYKIPKEIVFVDNLPKSPVGKILKRVLREDGP